MCGGESSRDAINSPMTSSSWRGIVLASRTLVPVVAIPAAGRLPPTEHSH
jgi:hypothetical protein